MILGSLLLVIDGIWTLDCIILNNIVYVQNGNVLA